jgi:hypothetical protein
MGSYQLNQLNNDARNVLCSVAARQGSSKQKTELSEFTRLIIVEEKVAFKTT